VSKSQTIICFIRNRLKQYQKILLDHDINIGIYIYSKRT